MKAEIEVEQVSREEFRVRVTEGDSESVHRVTIKLEYYSRLTGGAIAESELVKRSFEFLLRHEPKESILSKFDLKEISHYFPQYEGEIKHALSPAKRL